MTVRVVVPPSTPGQVIELVPSPLLTTVHDEPLAGVVPPLLGITTSVPSGQTIFFTPPSGEEMVQLVAPASFLGMTTVGLLSVAVVPSGQTMIWAPASLRLMVQDLPLVPSEPEQATRQSAKPAGMRLRTIRPRFIVFSPWRSSCRPEK